MTSQINTVDINANFPVQGADNPSQGFRDNFSEIVAALDIAAEEITVLQNNPGGIFTATTTSTGLISVGFGLTINTSSGNVSVLMPSYTTATLATITPTNTGTMVFVTDAPGGSQPCYFDGSFWYTVNSRIRAN